MVPMYAVGFRKVARRVVAPGPWSKPVMEVTTMASILLYAFLSSVNSRELQLLHTWHAVCWVESRGDPRAVGDGGAALGIGQIHRIMVDDCNRILGRRRWSYADRLCPVKSFAMFRVYCQHYYPSGGPEQWSRAWNGGPDGPGQDCTLGYWRKVRAELRQHSG